MSLGFVDVFADELSSSVVELWSSSACKQRVERTIIVFNDAMEIKRRNG